MSDTIITVENLSKRYRLGQIGATSLRESAERFLHHLRGRNPEHAMAEIGAGEKYGGDGAEELWALNDVSFEVKQGEVLGVIGRNGAGKSTLLKILTRITEPTSGRAIMRGRVASLLEVGTGFHPELTGRENIYLNGAILGMKKYEISSKFDEIVAFAEVEKFIDTPVKRYSSGMYVRLAFAVAAHLEPEILLVDEVLAVGDAQFQKKCLGKMQDVAKHGRTVLFVSHNMGAIAGFCSNCLLIEAGRLLDIGLSQDVIAKYWGLCSHDRSSHKEWSSDEKPGDDTLTLESVSICQPQGVVCDNIDITRPFSLEIKMNINVPLPELAICLVVWSIDGQKILQTADLKHASDIAKFSGEKSVICHFPAYLFTAGDYVATIAADIPYTRVIFHLHNVVRWRVQNSCSLFGRYSKMGEGACIGPGIVDWSIEYQQSSRGLIH